MFKFCGKIEEDRIYSELDKNSVCSQLGKVHVQNKQKSGQIQIQIHVTYCALWLQTDFLTKPIPNNNHGLGVVITTASRTTALLWVCTVTENFSASSR